MNGRTLTLIRIRWVLRILVLAPALIPMFIVLGLLRIMAVFGELADALDCYLNVKFGKVIAPLYDALMTETDKKYMRSQKR